MSVELKKLPAMELRSLGLDERWLQERITEDPSLLGLGELEIAAREHRQPIGGRIDFLMRNSEAETYYEVEIMLGALDESHIIRTIEYWDVERQRRPQYDHRAVIVAEQITGRFFNVIRLLNRAVPLIAVKLSAFKLDGGSIGLHAITVLDVIEETADSDLVDPAEKTDRAYWQNKVDASSLSVVDQIVTSLKASGVEPRLTYNRYHIAMGSTGYNFCWFHPRVTPGHCHLEFRAGENRDAVLATLQNAGIDASPRRVENITFGTTATGLGQQLQTINEVLKNAELQSRK
jgi:hypothetical protein